MKAGYLVVLLATLLLVGCASEEAAPEAGAPSGSEGGADAPGEEVEAEPAVPAGADVSVLTSAFEPEELTVQAGATVTWTNNAGRTQVFGGPRRLFSTKVADGETFSFTFEEAGVYKITNTVPLVFAGTVTVE